MPENKRLFLLDAYALIYRAFFAFSKNPRINSKGQNTSAILGFVNTLLDVLRNEKPSYIAVVFDTSEPTERHTIFPEYKAHRERMPEDIALAIPYIKDIIQAFNINMIAVNGYEADDVIGTLAKKAEVEGYTTYMMTPDKDFAQLVSDNIFMYKPSRMGKGVEVWGVREVCENFEISSPNQVIDILGLWGDASDNIPGVPGIGEKTSKELIRTYGSIENLIKNSADLKGKQKENMEKYADQALLSKKLATIIIDVPIQFDEELFKRKEPDIDKVKAIFDELEFRTLLSRLLSIPINTNVATESKPKTTSSSSKQLDLFSTFESIETEKEQEVKRNTAENTSHHYYLIDTIEKRKKLKEELLKQKEVCFDTETTNIDAHKSELVGFSFSIKPHEAYYVSCPRDYHETYSIINEFKEVFENSDIIKIGQNLKYDISVLRWYDIKVNGKLFDTMLAHYLLQPDMRHNMNFLAETYLNYTPIPIESLIGKKGKDQVSMQTVELGKIVEYACEDADVTLQLKQVFEPELKEFNALKLFEEIEMPLIHVLSSMENTGVSIDSNVLKEYSKELQYDINKIEQNIYSLAGREFNISSPKQLGDILFDELKIDSSGKMTKTKQYSTNEEILIKLKDKHPIIENILEYRSLKKLLSTYVDTLPGLVNPRTNRIHTSYNQAITTTGRLSSNNPNLQNIPVRTEKGREIRKAFIPRNKDYIFFSADYSQIELRIMAALSNDENMIEAFSKGIDIHTATASKVNGIAIEQVTREMRSQAKTVNFGIIYGISAFGLSQRINISRTQAAQLIEQYFKQYSKVKEYMDKSIASARDYGFVETIMGRRRYLRDINSHNATLRGYAERNAINAPIQGSSADIIKKAMIDIYDYLSINKLKTKMIMQVHDELVFDMHKDELEILKPVIIDKMKNAVKLSVPLEVETGTGENWLEAH